MNNNVSRSLNDLRLDRPAVRFGLGSTNPVASSTRANDNGNVSVNDNNDNVIIENKNVNVNGRPNNSLNATLIERERYLLQLERELLQRERELLQSTYRPREIRNETQVYMRDTGDNVVPDFNPDQANSLTAPQWIRKLKNIALAYKWNDHTLLLHAMPKLKGAARVWFSSIQDGQVTWARFQDQIIRAFPAVFDEAEIHRELSTRPKQKDETYENYFYTMKTIAAKADVGEQSVIKYILKGIGDEGLKRSLALCRVADVHGRTSERHRQPRENLRIVIYFVYLYIINSNCMFCSIYWKNKTKF